MVDGRAERFLLVKGAAGLGNRLTCLATAILYARLTGRTLVVDWTDPNYSADGSNAFHRYFRVRSCRTADSVPPTESVAPGVWRGHLDERVGRLVRTQAPDVNLYHDPESWRRFTVDLSTLDHPERVVVMWAFYDQVDELRPHFRGRFDELTGTTTREILRRVIREDLEPQPEIRERVDRFRAEHFTGRIVGVHLRGTDKLSPLRAMRRRLERLLEAQPGLRVFLATDSVAIENAFKERYPSLVVTEKWLPADAGPLHKHPENPDPQGHGVAALVDIYLLAACDYLIGDESSAFALIAGLLTRAPEANVFNLQRGRAVPPRLRHRLWLAKKTLQRLRRKLRP